MMNDIKVGEWAYYMGGNDTGPMYWHPGIIGKVKAIETQRSNQVTVLIFDKCGSMSGCSNDIECFRRATVDEVYKTYGVYEGLTIDVNDE